jgi:hypothetical protein
LVPRFAAKVHLPPPPPGPVQPLLVRRPSPPSASILLPRKKALLFRECDDERLRAIMSVYPPIFLPQQEWEIIADRFGGGVSGRQLQAHWFNHAKPGLDTGPFTMGERRQVAALAIDHPGQWKWISRQIGDGRCRSAGMVKALASRLIWKLRDLGVEIQSGSDIEFVPDKVFDPGRVTGFEREEVTRFNATKALCTVPVQGSRMALSAENLVARPGRR